jgi:hypothetical protein
MRSMRLNAERRCARISGGSASSWRCTSPEAETRGSSPSTGRAGKVAMVTSSGRASLRDITRVLAFWPRERMLELAPKHWAKTRGHIDTIELAAELGELTVPPAEQQTEAG